MTGSDTDLRSKARAAFLAFIMVTSVIGATVAFSGSAAAAQTGLADVRVTEDLTVRADNPGEEITLEIDVNTDGNAAGTTNYDIDVSSLQNAGVVNFGSASLSGSSAQGIVNSVSWDGTENDVVVNYDDDATSNTETISVTIGDTTGTPLQTSGVSPGASYTVSVVDDAGSFSSVSTSSTIDAADINIGSVTRDPAGTGSDSVNLGQDVYVGVSTLTYDSDGANVVDANVEGTVTVEQPELGNRSVTLNDGGASNLDNRSVENYIEGDHNLYVQAGDLSDGTAATNADQAGNQNAYTVSGLRTELSTPEGEVASEDTVLYNSQQSVEGTVYRTSANAPTQVVADDRVTYYEFNDPNGDLVASGDTNTGQFSVSESWDYTETNGGYERLDGFQYTVNVGDTSGSPPGGNTGSDTFTTLLDINWEIDGTDLANADVTYDDTVQISGTVEDGSGNAISGYRVATAIYDDTNAEAKTGTTTTGNNGQFSFTFRYNDGYQDPQATTIVGDDTGGLGVHLGTQQDSQANFDFASGTNNPVVRYDTLSLQPQDAQISVQADDNAPINFQDTYRIQVTDEDGNALDDQRVLVQGAFEGPTSGTGVTINNVPGNENPGLGDQKALEDVTGDGNADDVTAFFAETNNNGWLNFTATPLQSSFTVNATAEDVGIASGADSNSGTQITIPAGNQDGQATIHAQPDAENANGVTYTLGGADPVNIVNDDVEDSQTGYDAGDVTNNAPANYQSIFSDDGPEVVEVIPLTDTTANRLGADDSRLGYDVNYDLDGMTAYRVTFELRDEANANIAPGTASGEFDQMRVTGAGINATVTENGAGGLTVASGDNVLDAQYNANTYQLLIRPTEVESENPTIDHEIDVNGENNVTYTVDADGLNVAEFQVDGETTDQVQPNTVVDVTSVIQDATQDDAPINNGRVRLSQNGTELTDFDARTQNTNDGEYTFEDVNVGSRGFDSAADNDGIGESLSTLDFTAYQYDDANDDQSLVQREVNKGAVESLDIALDDSLQVEYDAENTSKYSGTSDGNFTLTRGVEYDQVAFELTQEDGTPVDLTEGLNGNTVNDLNDLAHQAPGNNDPELVTLTTPNGEASVRFDTGASDPADGYYVISDIEEVSNIDTTQNGVFADGDSFVFGSPSTDAGELPYTLTVETPDRSQATNASETGTFVTADANVETEVAGAAGGSVPNSVNDTNSDGDLIDELNHNQNDWSQLNTSVSEIETPTSGINRVYRVNATVTDALGTPLNNSDYNDIRADFDGSVDPTPSGNSAGDNAKFEMVNGPDVAVGSDDGIQTFGDGFSGGSSTDDEATIQNQNGTFQFDIEVETAGEDGDYTPVFEVEAQSDTTTAPLGKSDASQGPTIENPVVNVYGENGGELPVDSNTQNQILANDVQNRLRVEAFPADQDGFVLPNGLSYTLLGTFAETNVGTSTQNINQVETATLETEGYESGQIGFFQATPTGTGANFAALQSGGVTVRDQNGTPVLFDVLSTNRQIDLTISPTNPSSFETVTIKATDVSTTEVVGEVSITVESPQGRATTLLTDSNGVATLNASFLNEAGQYTISTRRAGYAPADTQFSVSSVSADVTFDDQTVSNGTSTVTVASANAGTEYYVEITDTNDTTLGTTSTFNAGTSQTDVNVSLSQNLTANQTLTATLRAASDDAALASDDATITIGDDGTGGEDIAEQYDSNNNGQLDIGEVRTAINDFAAGELSIDEVRNLINIWADGTAV